jgi:exodeoxyribonuclease V gamma subunit
MLEIVRGNSLGSLAERCASVLATPPDDPLVREWIATPTPGVARWLSLELARHLGASGPDTGDGISANIEFARVGHLRRAVLQAGLDDPREADPWLPERVFWTLCALYQDETENLDLPALAEGVTLTARARRTSGLFTRYETYRPAMLRAWAQGRDVDGDCEQLPDADLWQPRLFRALRDRLATSSPAERLPDLECRLREGSLEVDLPGRVTFFGFVTPPGGSEFASLLDAVAANRSVHCLLLDPAPAGPPDTWQGLTRSWAVGVGATREVFAPFRQHMVPPVAEFAASPASLLGRLQRHLQGEPVCRLPNWSETDGSLRVHGCQGARRQVEALRDAICARLEDDDTLTEEDIVVFCGDLARFTPLIHSVFTSRGRSSDRADVAGELPAGSPTIRYRIDGAGGGPENPVVVAVRAVLGLVSSRFSALDVVEFCGLTAVRRRWGFDDEDLASIRDWVIELDVRWGIDGAHRAQHGIDPAIVAGTWRRALDRLALGVAHARDDVVVGDDLVPYAVESDGAQLLGRLADLLARLAALSKSAAEPMPTAERLRELAADLEALVAPEDGADWQLDALHRMCQVDFDDSGTLQTWAGELPTTLSDLRPELLHRLEGGGWGSGGFRGGVTFTTTDRLAGVPFRVVGLLGLDEGAVPSPVRDGDDLLGLDPRSGDPDPRSATLAAYLAAIGSAGDALDIFHDVRDLTTNQQLPDSVALAELWGEIRQLGPAGNGAVDTLRINHPRHGTDPDNFIDGALVDGRPWSFDPLALAGARARITVGSTSNTPTSRTSVPAPDVGPVECEQLVELSDLAAFLEDPAKHLCRGVLDVRLPREAGDLQGHLRTGLDLLEESGIRRELFEAHQTDGAAVDTAARLRLLTAQDRLPVGTIGASDFTKVDDEAAALAEAARAARPSGETVTMPVDLKLDGGRRITGKAEVFRTPDGCVLFSARASRLKVGHRLSIWIELLALAASFPGESFEAILIGRPASSSSNKPFEAANFGVVDDGHAARRALQRIVDWRDALCRSPEAVSFQAFASWLLAGGGDGWSDRPIDKKVRDAWDRASGYSAELQFLSAGRPLFRILDEPLLPRDPEPQREMGRVAGFLADLDRHWQETVVTEGGAG